MNAHFFLPLQIVTRSTIGLHILFNENLRKIGTSPMKKLCRFDNTSVLTYAFYQNNIRTFN